MMNKNGMLVVISGFSGAGKTTILNNLLEKYPDEFVKSVSVTTRERREEEREGIDYFFRTKEEFEHMLACGELLEWDTYVDNFYGTPKFFIDKELYDGKIVLLVLNTFGAKYIKKQYPNSVLIFVTPENIDILYKRLEERSSESNELINKRKSEMLKEIEDIPYYDYLVINNEIEECVSNVYKIINSNKMSVQNNMNLVNDFKEKLKNK